MLTNFVPYLPTIMELILTSAAQSTNFIMVDAEEDEVEGEVRIYIILKHQNQPKIFIRLSLMKILDMKRPLSRWVQVLENEYQ